MVWLKWTTRMRFPLAGAVALLGVLFAFSVAPSASGAEILTYGPYEVTPGDPAYSDSFTIDLFDVNDTPYPTYARLTKVELILTGTLSGTLGIENTDDAASEFSVTLTTDFQLSRDDTGAQLTTVQTSFSGSGILDRYDNVTDSLGPSGETLTVSGSESSLYSTEFEADLAEFAGTGTLLLNLNVLAEDVQWSATGGKSYTPTASPLAGASLEVRYTYIPEPCTGLLCAWIGLLACLKRPRRGRKVRALPDGIHAAT